ncbi:MAG: M48 family metalloprotease [Gammaproteobacteria bacterium]|nr:M48 family metalloprotease [Gammaproteobacteria bacterium]
MRRTLAPLALLLAFVAACATNPESGTHHVVFTTVKGEQEQSRRIHQEIIKFYGLYQDQALQDYVQMVGTRVARNTPIADWDFKFFVIDDESINAFTIGGGYVYVHRGLLPYLNSEAELAAVLGHEIGHDVARHPARSQARGVLLGVGALATAIMTGNAAIAEMADLGAEAWYQGYGRDQESEADRLGLEYAARTGYRPSAMTDTMKVFKAQESFELARARDEGRDPNVYHGAFSDHPAPDDRIVQATLGASHTTAPPGGWVDNRDAYLKAIDGLPFGSSREQGIVRDNRFYHAGMKVTMAFPRGWTVQNERDRLLIFTKKKESLMQVTLETVPPKKSPREFLLQRLRGAAIARGDQLSVHGMEGYAIVTRQGSPLDGGAGPVRWAVLYRGTQAFVFGAASRSSESGIPLDDGVFMSSIGTLRDMRPAEYPLSEPFRLKVIQATDKTRIDDYAKDMPTEKFKKEELRLLNGLWPKGEAKPGDFIKVVQ